MITDTERQVSRQFQSDWLYACARALAALEPPLTAAERNRKRICAHHERNLLRRLELTIELSRIAKAFRSRNVPGPYRTL